MEKRAARYKDAYCEDCVFFVYTREKSSIGQCRYNPPVYVNADPDNIDNDTCVVSAFPDVFNDTFCSKFLKEEGA